MRITQFVISASDKQERRRMVKVGQKRAQFTINKIRDRLLIDRQEW